MARNRVTEAQVSLYEQEQKRASADFETLAENYVAGKISLAAFESLMKAALKSYYIRIALIAKGKHPFTKGDKRDLEKFLGLIYGYLDGFIEDLGIYSRKRIATDRGVISRASSYGVGWGVFSRFSLPGPVVDLLPSLPGISCLGDGSCGCILEYEVDEEGFKVYWYVSAFKEHCPVCVDNSIEWSPYEVSFEEVDMDEWEEEDFWDGGFIF